MFFFFAAKFTDEEIQTMVKEIRRNVNKDKNFEIISKYFGPFLTKKVYDTLAKTRYIGFAQKDDTKAIFNICYQWLYELIIHPRMFNADTDSFSKFEAMYKNVVNKNLLGHVHHYFGAKTIKTSRPTEKKIMDIASFQTEYHEKNKRLPSIKEIAEHFKWNENIVNKLLEAGNLYNIKSINQTVGKDDESDSTLEDFITSPSDEIPEQKFFNNEEKRVLQKAILRNIPKVKSFIKELADKSMRTDPDKRKSLDEDRITIWNNIDEIIKFLVKNQGKRQLELQKHLKLSNVKLIFRLWQYLLESLRNDDQLKQWVQASKTQKMINKVSNIMTDFYYSKTSESLIKKIVKESSGRKYSR